MTRPEEVQEKPEIDELSSSRCFQKVSRRLAKDTKCERKEETSYLRLPSSGCSSTVSDRNQGRILSRRAFQLGEAFSSSEDMMS